MTRCHRSNVKNLFIDAGYRGAKIEYSYLGVREEVDRARPKKKEKGKKGPLGWLGQVIVEAAEGEG